MRSLAIVIILSLVGCTAAKPVQGKNKADAADTDVETDADADTDTDSDTDADADADSDADADTGATGDTGPVSSDVELCVNVDIPDVWHLYYLDNSESDSDIAQEHWFQNALATGTGRLCGTMTGVDPGEWFKLNSDYGVSQWLVMFDGVDLVSHITSVEVGGLSYVVEDEFAAGVDCAIEPYGYYGGDILCQRRL